MAVGQNQWYHFGVRAPPVLVYFSGDWDVHWGVRDFDPWPYLFDVCSLFVGFICFVVPPVGLKGTLSLLDAFSRGRMRRWRVHFADEATVCFQVDSHCGVFVKDCVSVANLKLAI